MPRRAYMMKMMMGMMSTMKTMTMMMMTMATMRMRKWKDVTCDAFRLHFLRSSRGARLGRLAAVFGPLRGSLGGPLGPFWAL